jgi:hypothetical protein
MISIFYPLKDTTIYEDNPDLNSGVDQILELIHKNSGGDITNSRILLKFDTDNINKFIQDYSITPLKYELVLHVSKIEQSPIELNINALPVSGNWEGGSGNTNVNTNISDGTSWSWKTFKSDLYWITQDTPSGSFSYNSITGGGTWHTESSFQSTQSILNIKNDVVFNLTNVFDAYTSGTIQNDGIIIKYADYNEMSTYPYYSYKFFSNESNTIYSPKLRMVSDDTVYITGSLGILNTNKEYTIYSKMKEVYNINEIAKIRIFSRPKFIEKTYSTNAQYLINYALPENSFYEIRDNVTNDIIIPFDTIGTKLSCDGTSNYFTLFMNNFQPERYYKIIIKTKISLYEEIIVDDDLIFKVVQ